MTPKQRKTFFLYDIGRSPEQLCLGHLVWRDYANPTQGRYLTQPKLSDVDMEQHTYSTPFSGLIAQSQELTFGPILQLPEIAEVTLQFHNSKARGIFAGNGRRVELRNPEEFLKDKVLKNESTRKNFLAWVTAANSTLVRAKALFRPPKIWLLTGLHELVDACAYEFKSSSPLTTLGVGSGLMSALAGVPIGASVNVAKGITATSMAHIQGAAIWSARWQQIDLEYFRMSDEQHKLLDQSISLRLLKDNSFSRGTLLADNNKPNAVGIAVAKDIDDDDDGSSDIDTSQDTYDRLFTKAIDVILEDTESDIDVHAEVDLASDSGSGSESV